MIKYGRPICINDNATESRNILSMYHYSIVQGNGQQVYYIKGKL